MNTQHVSQIHEGTIVFYNSKKGFGMIQNKLGEFFFHVASLIESVHEGEQVKFESKPSTFKNKFTATKITKVGETNEERNSRDTR